MIPRVKGTNDFIDLNLYNFVIDAAKKHLHRYNFSEIQTPILESVELFKRSLGVYTDVVSKEMFTIQPHAQSSELICLRPEMTASTVRAFLENRIEIVPWRVFSYGPVFRYERPQKGRFRQFHQLTIELIGAQSVAYDVQLITMLDRFFHELLRLDTYALLINFLGCTLDRVAYRTLLQEFLNGKAICSTCSVRKETNTLRVFDCKNEECQAMYKNAPRCADNLCQECAAEWLQVQEQLSLLSVSYIVQPSLVRGLDYYTKTAFEFVSNDLGAQNAFCGGGRYDGLVEQLEPSTKQPAVGAAIGLERLMLLLESRLDTIPFMQKDPLHVIMPLSQEQHSLALLLADQLIAEKITVEILFDGSIKQMMRKANKMGAVYALLLGQEEQESLTVTLKNMVTGHQDKILQVDCIGYLKK